MPSCLDMALRGRPVSDTPEQTVEKLSEATHVPRPRDKNTKANRLSGLGPFDRIVAGLVPNPCCTAPTAGWKPPLLAEIGHTLLTRDGAGERRNELPHSA
jgi:hypothetical protein